MNPKLSLIIPVYGTERYLSRCIESVTNQIYKNLEIIIVNDCSPGDAEVIIKQYQENDSRIKYIKHEVNRGLYQARVTGSKQATGDYIAFLDSDDYVSFDFYYGLIEAAENKNADMAVGKTVREKEDGTRIVNHFHNCSMAFDQLEGEAIRNTFFSQQGRCYSWHTVWNKIYKRELWDKASPYYDRITNHVIMTEDIAFSSVLFYFAQKMVTTQSSCCFYCENQDASTNSNNMSFAKFSKNINDITTVFDFVASFLKEMGASQTIMEDYDGFRKFYARMWLALVDGVFVGKYRTESLEYINKLYPDLSERMQPEDYFFDSLQTEWHEGYEMAKKVMAEPNITHVSFDIFDTLINRPLYKPTDVFDLLNEDFTDLVGTNVLFSKVRIEAEAEARRQCGELHPEYQDVTIDEIYEQMGRSYGLSEDIVKVMKQKEINLEIMLSSPRQSSKQLYELAKHLGKTIIIVSDMYLTEDVIRKILDKNGYEGYEHLFVSSKERLTKHSGDLFKYVLNDLGVPSHRIIHYGDTWVNDFENPQKLGFKTFFLPKAMEVFENKIQGQQTNRCAFLAELASGNIADPEEYRNSIGYGAMLSMAANKYFDNPYSSFNEMSDLNADPYFVGYYVVGMHLFGFSKWLIENSMAKGYKKLYFLSRDGYLPMCIYNIVARYYPGAPAAEYLYSSRKAVMPYIVKEKFDLFDLPVAFLNHSPMTLKQILSFCMEAVSDEGYKEELVKQKIDPDERFADRDKYNQFVRVFLDSFYSEAEHNKSKSLCSEYYSMIEPDAATVDMGYSGRIQGAISAAAQRGVDVFFIHSDKAQHHRECRKYGFNIFSFYDYEPYVSGVFREHLFSGIEPSCIGFEKADNGAVVPVFEDMKKEITDSFIVTKIHQGATDFATEFTGKFASILHRIPIKPIEVSYPYEGFLRFASATDLKIFTASFFEDEVWGGANRINIAAFIHNQYAHFNQKIVPVQRQVLPEYALPRYEPVDQTKEEIKTKLSKFPGVYNFSKWLYRKIK